MQEQSVISLHEVYKTRGQHTIGPINFELPQGYITVLVGENGAGKSTLLNLMMQTIYPDQGWMTWFGQSEKDELPLHIRQRIAYVSEHSSIEENRMTALEAARFRSHWYPKWNQKKFEQLLIEFQVPSNTHLSKVSKGQRQKFEFAAAIATTPDLLLMDEPSSGLDPFAWKDMIRTLHQLMDTRGISILITTHRMEEVERLADYVMLMNDGIIYGIEEKDTLYQQWKEIWINAGAGDTDVIHNLRDCDGIIAWEVQSDLSVRIITTDALQLEAAAAENGIPTQTRGLEWEDLLYYWRSAWNQKRDSGSMKK